MPRNLDDIRDELLVLEAQAGREDAFRQLVSRWHPRLAAFAWRLCGDREAAGDITQEAWLAIVRNLRGLQDPALFGTWAYRAVVRKYVDGQRRQKSVPGRNRGSGGLAFVVAPERPEPDDAIGRIRGAMHALPPSDRAMIALRHLDGLDIHRIAAIFGLPPGTVKSRLHHARQELRRTLERSAR